MLISLMALAIQTQSLAHGIPQGDRLEEGQMCYALATQRDGVSQTLGRTLQVVSRKTLDGRPVVRVLVHQQLQGGAFDVRDEFILEAGDLRPIRYVSQRNGAVRVDVIYGPDAVTGYRVADDGQREDLSVPVSEAVWEGNLWGVVFAAMPLSENSQLSLPFWHYEKGFGRFSLQVVASEVLSTPVGDVPGWVVEASDGSGPKVTYRVARDQGLEISYAAGAFTQTPGGDCSGLSEE